MASLSPLHPTDLYFRRGTQAKFTADQRPQYIYSPRELSRWVRALYEAMSPLDAMTLEELVRLWANEALRLFHDRLVTQEEQDWCQCKVMYLLFTGLSGRSRSNSD